MEEGTQRWIFNSNSWKPSPSQFSFCLSLLRPSQQDDVLKFVKFEDQKRALISRLMQLMLVHLLLNVNYSDVLIFRTNEGKPYVGNSLYDAAFPNLNFSISHHGDYVALASEALCIVGLDIMTHDEDYGHETAHQYVSNFEPYFTPFEWAIIHSSGPDPGPLLDQFNRYWCMKEAYIKAVGIGLGFDLRRIEFYFPDGDIWSRMAYVRVDGLERDDWCFHLEILNNHWVCVARGPPEAAVESFKATLSIVELDKMMMTTILRKRNKPFSELLIENLIPNFQREEFKALGASRNIGKKIGSRQSIKGLI